MGQKLLLCFPLGSAHSRYMLQGFCMNKTHPFAPNTVVMVGHKSQSLCIYLSLSSLQGFAYYAAYRALAVLSICTALQADRQETCSTGVSVGTCAPHTHLGDFQLPAPEYISG